MNLNGKLVCGMITEDPSKEKPSLLILTILAPKSLSLLRYEYLIWASEL
jgi:hypothetical protein